MEKQPNPIESPSTFEGDSIGISGKIYNFAKQKQYSLPLIFRGANPMKKIWIERIIAVALIFVCIYLGNMAREFPVHGGDFPLFAFATIGLFSLLLLITSFSSKKSAVALKVEKRESLYWRKLKPYLLFLLMVTLSIMMERVGYFESVGVFLISAPLLLGTKKIYLVLITVLIMLSFFYLLVVVALRSYLPEGILF